MIRGLEEIIVYVTDMESQVRFYRDALGLEVTHPVGLDDYGDQHWVVFDTGACSLALHGGGTRQFGADAPKFVFGVEDVVAARERLLAVGVSLGEIRSPAPGVEVVDGRDPEGNVFSLENRGT